MKKFVVCVVFFLSLCVGFAFVSEYKSASDVNISTEYIPPASDVNNDVSETSPAECVFSVPKKYKLKEYEGNLAIFKMDNTLPMKITSISIENLPSTDQEMLKQGIEASSEEELTLLLEDYGS